MSTAGVDYDSREGIPSPAALTRANVKFACRYGGMGSAAKMLTGAERDALFAAGIDIVANVEGAQDGLLGGAPAGQTWAHEGEKFFTALDMPGDRPIYLSADFDVTSPQWPQVRNALHGAASVIGLDRVGIYGGYNAMAWARRDGVARWFWQTYAWSGGRWAAGNHIEQYRNGVVIDGVRLDLDRGLTDDFGQWGGSEMVLMDDKDFAALAYRVEALVSGRDVVIGGPTKGEKVQAWNTIADKLAADPEFLAAMKRQVQIGDVTVPSAPLGDADKPAIIAAVQEAFRRGTDGVV